MVLDLDHLSGAKGPGFFSAPVDSIGAVEFYWHGENSV